MNFGFFLMPSAKRKLEHDSFVALVQAIEKLGVHLEASKIYDAQSVILIGGAPALRSESAGEVFANCAGRPVGISFKTDDVYVFEPGELEPDESWFNLDLIWHHDGFVIPCMGADEPSRCACRKVIPADSDGGYYLLSPGSCPTCGIDLEKRLGRSGSRFVLAFIVGHVVSEQPVRADVVAALESAAGCKLRRITDFDR